MAKPDAVRILVTLHGDTTAYVTGLAVLYASLRTHTAAELEFWIVHDDTVPAEALESVRSYIAHRDAVRLVDIGTFPAIASICRQCADPRYSPAVLWRVFVTELCPGSRVILLDADLVFLCDVLALWDVDVADVALAASLRGKPWPAEYHSLIDTPPERYFRIGVSVLNLDQMRADLRFMTGREDFLLSRLPKVNELVCLPEQSLFNFFFNRSMKPLELNLCPAGHFNASDPNGVEVMLGRMTNLNSLVLDLKGWQERSPFDYFYWCYLMMTPWRGAAYAHLARHQRLGVLPPER